MNIPPCDHELEQFAIQTTFCSLVNSQLAFNRETFSLMFFFLDNTSNHNPLTTEKNLKQSRDELCLL